MEYTIIYRVVANDGTFATAWMLSAQKCYAHKRRLEKEVAETPCKALMFGKTFRVEKSTLLV